MRVFLIFLITICSCNNSSKNTYKKLTRESLFMFTQGKEWNFKERIITVINGDCSHCTDRIPYFSNMIECLKNTNYDFIILVYSENNLYLVDTCALRNANPTIPIIFDKYNIFQIKNNLPRYAYEYSIFINQDLEIIDIGKPNEIFKKYVIKK